MVIALRGRSKSKGSQRWTHCGANMASMVRVLTFDYLAGKHSILIKYERLCKESSSMIWSGDDTVNSKRAYLKAAITRVA